MSAISSSPNLLWAMDDRSLPLSVNSHANKNYMAINDRIEGVGSVCFD